MIMIMYMLIRSEIKIPEESKIPSVPDKRVLKCMEAQQFRNDFCVQLSCLFA